MVKDHSDESCVNSFDRNLYELQTDRQTDRQTDMFYSYLKAMRLHELLHKQLKHTSLYVTPTHTVPFRPPFRSDWF